MSQNYHQPICNNFLPQANSNTSNANNYYLTSAPNDQHPQNNFTNQQIPIQSDQPIMFFYQPPNDPYNYHIKCRGISFDALTITQLLNDSFDGNINSNQNEYIFFYQHHTSGQIYQIVCEIVTSLSLNRTVYGIENFGQVQSSFTFNQKQNLKSHLIQHLNNYLLY
ncbi:hypothetical protein RclHR1_15140004 [Rhizophagus clarus]|uniref:Uncharacterized protein n=1 Tax=Rhizophagus clarus TaxID=94130 RepID=A0A2Z6QEG7_9GLOM|nr:hypothetical protein RclHR1_15140004 [Rhizophagus clarus]GES92319.1 hypothetical protein GLOIN_2v1786766 [Rhizophagus clarus]